MKHLFVWFLCASLIFSSSAGCSINAMNQKPSPLPIDIIKEHPTRGELISVFGKPQYSEVINDQRTDYFKFIDGYHGSTKLRGLVYAAGCLFTLCISELIFWPLEENAMIGEEGTAIATYNNDNVAEKLEILDKKGNPWNVNWRTASAEVPGDSQEDY